MPTNYIKTNDPSTPWKPISQFWIKVQGYWKSVSEGWIKVAGDWKQFFGSNVTYTFSFGNTVHVGTNGYISLDTGQSADSISNTVGRVLGILPADLVMNNVYWAANSSNFYVFWSGRRYSGGTNNEIQYEVRFTDGQDYAQIKLVAFPTSTYSLTGFYVDGSSTGYSRITATRTVGAEYRVYFNSTPAFVSTFVEFGSDSHPVWLPSGSVTSGTLDSGYFTILASQGSSSQAPGSVAASSITNTTATVSWTIPAREDRGMSQIQSYDYSINGGSSWTSTSTSTSVNLTGLTANTSYTVLVRANNYYFTGTNYGTVTFSTTNITVPGAVRNLSYSLISAGARISWDAPLSDGGSAITKYQIRRDSASFFDNSPLTSTTYDYTLSPNTYTVYVRAVNAIGNGPESSVSVTIPTPTPVVSSCNVITGGRTGSSPNFVWPNPKALFTFTCTNASSADVQIQYSQFGISWLDANVVQNLSVIFDQVSIQTNQPGTNIGNYYYRATCKPYSGSSGSGTAGTQVITASVQNTQTAKNQAIGIS